MIKIYLWANALIYVLFSFWCSTRKEQTSVASGYLFINNSGWSEYLVIYGGLQLGMALFFAYLALHVEYHILGLVFALLLYIPVVTYRVITIYRLWPVKSTTLAIAAVEAILLLGAAFCVTVFKI